jgi:hypothetical protein
MKQWPQEVQDAGAQEGPRKLFSPQDAQRALVLVRRIVDDVVSEYNRLLELQEILELEQRYGSEEYLDRVRPQMTASVNTLQAYVQELLDVGVELRDVARGQVDFPALAGAREIRLCWQHGDAAITHWYDPAEGQSKQHPIAELMAAIDQ